MKPLEELSTEELSRIRVKHAAKTKKDDFSRFSLNCKPYRKASADPLSKEDRKRINDIKESMTYDNDLDDLFLNVLK